jgi:hypothetical protein
VRARTSPPGHARQIFALLKSPVPLILARAPCTLRKKAPTRGAFCLDEYNWILISRNELGPSMSLKTISIVRAGPLTSRSPKGPNTKTPFVIEVETADGAAYLQMGPQASAVLAEELAIYLNKYASKA